MRRHLLRLGASDGDERAVVPAFEHGKEIVVVAPLGQGGRGEPGGKKNVPVGLTL